MKIVCYGENIHIRTTCPQYFEENKGNKYLIPFIVCLYSKTVPYHIVEKDKNCRNYGDEVKRDKGSVNFHNDSTDIYLAGFAVQCFFVDPDYGMKKIFLKRFSIQHAVFLEF